MYDTSEHFQRTNEYNEVGWLPLLPLDKVVQEKDELRDIDCHLNCHKK